MGNPIGWFEIYVQDMGRAARFYESVLEVALNHLEMEESEIWAFPMENEKYGASGALVKMEGIVSGGNSTLVYFQCADCGVTAQRVAAAGGIVHRDKTSIGPYGFIALALDPDGNMIGFHSMH